MRRGLFGWKTTVDLYSVSQNYRQVVWYDSTVRESLPLMIAKLDAGIDVALTGDGNGQRPIARPCKSCGGSLPRRFSGESISPETTASAISHRYARTSPS